MKTKGPRCTACHWFTELDPRPNANGRWRCRNFTCRTMGPQSPLAPSLDNEGRAVMNKPDDLYPRQARKPREFVSVEVKELWHVLDILVGFKEQHAPGDRKAYDADCDATRDKIMKLGEPDEARAICERMSRAWLHTQKISLPAAAPVVTK